MRIPDPLNQEVLHECPWLFSELGFKIIGYDFQPKHFGDSFVSLASDSLRVRFVRDRGQVIAEVASLVPPRKWWPIGFVLEAIHGVLPESKFDLQAAASLLQENFSDIVIALGPKLKKTEEELQKRAAERLRVLQSRGSE
jgi:hypothetical protein